MALRGECPSEVRAAEKEERCYEFEDGRRAVEEADDVADFYSSSEEAARLEQERLDAEARTRGPAVRGRRGRASDRGHRRRDGGEASPIACLGRLKGEKVCKLNHRQMLRRVKQALRAPKVVPASGAPAPAPGGVPEARFRGKVDRVFGFRNSRRPFRGRERGSRVFSQAGAHRQARRAIRAASSSVVTASRRSSSVAPSPGRAP